MGAVDDSNNKIILDWGRDRATKINSKKNLLGIKHSKGSKWNKVRSKSRKKGGRVIKVGVSAPKHAMFVKYGVGKGRGKNSDKKKPKDWTEPFYDGVEELSDSLMMNTADKLGNILLKIR